MAHIMPAALDVDREQVRMLVMQYGVREAARMVGLNENTVLAWSDRGDWLKNMPTPHRALMPPLQSRAIVSPANALADAMREDSVETRAAVLRIARRAVNRVGRYDDDELVQPEVADVLNKHVKTAALAGAWQNQSAAPKISLTVTSATESQGMTIDVDGRVMETVEDDPLAGF